MSEHVHDWQVTCSGCDGTLDLSEHFVTFGPESWRVEHSLMCRISGEMAQGCQYEIAIRDAVTRPPYTESRWRIVSVDSVGMPILEEAT
jgi:hypothetical protein